MTRIKNWGFIALGLSGLLLAGCASDPIDAPEAEIPEEVEEVVEAVVEVEPLLATVDSDGRLSVPVSDTELEMLEHVFYFDYDQAIVKRAGHAELDRHANALAEVSNIRVRLEGHADERGTREYNLALGERRANAIRAYLVAQGVSSSQIEVISFGEEKPAVMGESESAWAQNRRVELRYR